MNKHSRYLTLLAASSLTLSIGALGCVADADAGNDPLDTAQEAESGDVGEAASSIVVFAQKCVYEGANSCPTGYYCKTPSKPPWHGEDGTCTKQ